MVFFLLYGALLIVKHYFLFYLKALQIYLQFIEGEVETDTNSDSEDDDLASNLNEADDLNVDSLHLSDQVIYPLASVVIKDIHAMGNGVCYLFICYFVLF
jgi:hypothetical protein